MGEIDHQLLIELINSKNSETAKQLKGVLLEVNAGFNTTNASIENMKSEIVLIRVELEGYKDAKKEQNGRIKKLENATKVNSFIIDNPIKTIIIGFVAYLGIAELTSYIPFFELLKKINIF